MHPKERYEEIITGKLALLPLPDMADAIWARIERQLDIDLPSEDGGDVLEPPSPWGGGGMAVGAGFLAFVGALLAFFYFQNRDQLIQNNPPVNNTIETNAPVRNNVTTNLPPPQTTLIQPLNNAPKTATDQPPVDVPSEPDAAIAVAGTAPDSAVAAPQNFTAQSGITTPRLQPDVPPDTIPKKRRGLQNVSDKDYRIVPKSNNDP